MENSQYSKFDCKIMKNKKKSADRMYDSLRYIGPIRLFPIYLHRAAIWSICRKFHQDISKTERLLCVATDGQG